MVCNFSNIARAPEWRVEMHRKHGMNAVQNARKRFAYVIAPSEQLAKDFAQRKNPEFIAVSARKERP